MLFIGLTNGKIQFFSADHYRSVAKNYDKFYKAQTEALMPAVLRHMDDLQPDHLLADIGSGTGFVAERLFEARQLKHPIWCVDPCPEMQAVAEQRKGVYAVEKTAEEFVQDLSADQFFDKMLCIMCIHHFSQPVEILKGLRAHLHSGGQLLIFVIGKSTRLPVFSKAEETFRGIAKTYKKEGITATLREANFAVEVVEEKLNYIVKKSLWYDMLRGRVYSNLRKLSDEEIEDGIIELEKGKLKGLSLDDDVEIPNTLFVYRATKPPTKNGELTP